MTDWSGNGFWPDPEDVEDAMSLLGLMPCELQVLQKNARQEAEVADDVAAWLNRQGETEKAARWEKFGPWWRRRALKWKELEAAEAAAVAAEVPSGS